LNRDEAIRLVLKEVEPYLEAGRVPTMSELLDFRDRLKAAGISPQAYHTAHTLVAAYSVRTMELEAKLAGAERALELVCKNNRVQVSVKNQIEGSEMHNYQTGQAGAVGPHSHAHDMTFNQIWTQSQGEIDLVALHDELDRLRTAMKEREPTLDHDEAIGAIASASKLAIQKDGPKMLERLKDAGTWALDVAKDISADLAARVIAKAMGLPE
jgi:hypothetical protein